VNLATATNARQLDELTRCNALLLARDQGECATAPRLWQ
jgi:hypothetical protein